VAEQEEIVTLGERKGEADSAETRTAPKAKTTEAIAINRDAQRKVG
jgi:hypothetical protein